MILFGLPSCSKRNLPPPWGDGPEGTALPMFSPADGWPSGSPAGRRRQRTPPRMNHCKTSTATGGSSLSSQTRGRLAGVPLGKICDTLPL